MNTLNAAGPHLQNGLQNTGDGIAAANGRWSFAGTASEAFDEHVQRSVPLYLEGHDIVLKLSDFFLGDDSVCYEIGCATGELLKKLALHHQGKNCRFYGLDVEKDMTAKAREKCKDLKSVEILEGDAVFHDYEHTDLIIAYYTIQFVPPKKRQALFDRLFESLNWGGGLLLFEKVRAPDARFQDMMVQCYLDFKIDQGYTPDEIVGKSRSLKRILEPFSTQGNYDLLSRAGFKDRMSVMKYLCFEGFLSIK